MKVQGFIIQKENIEFALIQDKTGFEKVWQIN